MGFLVADGGVRAALVVGVVSTATTATTVLVDEAATVVDQHLAALRQAVLPAASLPHPCTDPAPSAQGPPTAAGLNRPCWSKVPLGGGFHQ